MACWDGSRAAGPARCPEPTGRDGLTSVFSSLRPWCAATPPSADGKVEAYVCDYGSYLIRYSRWQPGAQRFDHYAEPGANAGPWTVAGERAGTVWYTIERNSRPFQWAAAYADHPYSVSVEARTNALRERGIALVQAVAPEQLGLR